jgi:SAM-dependent methyltransferase
MTNMQAAQDLQPGRGRLRLKHNITMSEVPCRPFYAEYAWAFDLLTDRPVEKECGVIAAWLVGLEILPGAAILDAGCGTGRYSRELARRGYIVHGVDLSSEPIEVAKGTLGERTGRVSFGVADILAPPTARYAAILCRGVLNDIINDDRRDAVFAAFARTLRPHGALILDVRDWSASAERKTREPLFRKRVSTDRGELTFTSITELDAECRLLLISERHELVGRSDKRVSDYQFVMRCWDREELSMLFGRHGFGKIQYFGAYDHGVELGATDRLVAVAQLSIHPDKP